MPIHTEAVLARPIKEGDRLSLFRYYLNPHGCSVRQARISNLFYLTGKDRRPYMLHLSKYSGWLCTPIGHHDQYSADQLLDIAMGKRQREID